MTDRSLRWRATADAGKTLPVLGGGITVDATRNPQVSASLTLPHVDYATTKGFDPFTRKPAFIEINQSNMQGGTLATFAKPMSGWGAPWTEQLRNLAPNPDTVSSGTGFYSDYGVLSFSGGYARSTARVTGPNNLVINPLFTPVTAGQRATLRALVRNPTGVAFNTAAAIIWFNASTEFIGQVYVEPTPLAAGASGVRWASGIVPAGATQAIAILTVDSQAAGGAIDATAWGWYVGAQGSIPATDPPYFSGASASATPDKRYRWLGTQNASPSVLEAGTYVTPLPGTLAGLDWSQKASTPRPLGADVAVAVVNRTVKLYVTDVTVNETAGTFDVELASADHLLTELVNYGSDWYPPVYTRSGDVTYHYLNQVWDSFFQQFAVPLTTDFNGGVFLGLITNADPWRTGETAWSYLDKLRTQSGRRYVLNAATGLVTFPTGGTPAYVSPDRARASSVSVKRSVENGLVGPNQYADGVIVHWTDPTDADRPDVWDTAYTPADWRTARRSIVEDRDLLASGSVPMVAAGRLGRMSRFRRITTVTIAHDAAAAPFRDLSSHPNADSVQSIVFDYDTGNVTTAYLEAD